MFKQVPSISCIPSAYPIIKYHYPIYSYSITIFPHGTITVYFESSSDPLTGYSEIVSEDF